MSYEEFLSTFFSFDTDPMAESLSDIVPCLATSHCASQATQAQVAQSPVHRAAWGSTDSHATYEHGGSLTPRYDNIWLSPRVPPTLPLSYNENKLEALAPSLFTSPETQSEVDKERPRKKAKTTAGRMEHRKIMSKPQAEGNALHQATYTSTTSTHEGENPAGESVTETVQQRGGGPSVQLPAEEQDGAHQPQVILDPRVCPVCGFRSSRKYDVRRHMRTHKDQVEESLPAEEEDESCCDECDRVFARDDSLRRHKERKHGIRPPPRKLLPLLSPFHTSLRSILTSRSIKQLSSSRSTRSSTFMRQDRFGRGT